MAKLIKSLPAFQRSGIGPDHLYFFPFVDSSLQGSAPFLLLSPSLATVFCQAEDTGRVSTAVAVSRSPRKGRADAQPLPIAT